MSFPRFLTSPFTVGAAAFACAAFACGCASNTPARQTIHVSVDKSVEGVAIEVDVFGASTAVEKPKWEAFSVNEYWQPNNATRRDLADRWKFEFGRGKSAEQKLPAGAPNWERWLETGAAWAVVIADIPGIAPNGNDDPRRLLLPLAPAAWDKAADEPVRILVRESGLKLLTPLKQK